MECPTSADLVKLLRLRSIPLKASFSASMMAKIPSHLSVIEGNTPTTHQIVDGVANIDPNIP